MMSGRSRLDHTNAIRVAKRTVKHGVVTVAADGGLET
jgi:hypothetical protein